MLSRQRVAGALGVVKVPVGTELQVVRELVEVFADQGVVIEVLVEVRLSISVQIAKARDLVAAQHVDLFLDDLQAQRLKKPGGDTSPAEVCEGTIQPRDNPDITAPGRNGRAPSIGEEIHTSETHPGMPRIGLRSGEFIDGVRSR